MKRRDPRKPTEFQIQCAVVEYLRINALGSVMWLHVPNQQAGGAKRGAYLKRMGVMPGAADLLLLRKDDTPIMLWLEIKAPGQRPTKRQQEFADLVRSFGCEYWWADSVELAIDLLKKYGWCR